MSAGRTRTIPIVIALAIGILFVWRTIYIDFIIFAGMLLAIVLRRLAQLVDGRLAFGRSWSLSLVVVVLAVLGVTATYLFANTVFSQISQLSARLEVALTTAEENVRSLPWGNAILAGFHGPNGSTGFLDDFFGVASNAFALLGAIVAVIFFGIYLAAEPGLYLHGLLCLFPERLRARAEGVLADVGNVLWYWSLGRLFSMSVVAVGTITGLAILGMPLPIVLGGLAGLLTFVPYLGSIAAAVPALVFALSISLGKTIYVLVLYTLVHITEGYVLVPLVQRRAAHLPPALILSSQLVLGALAGVVGITFAAPLLAAGLPIARALIVYRDDGVDSMRRRASQPDSGNRMSAQGRC